MIKVTCGIIKYYDKYLITQRSKNKKEYPLYWELPGGKCETNESIENCLIREIKEELNINVKFKNIIYIKNNFLNKYDLYYCLCSTNDQNIKVNNEIEKYKNIDKNELLNYNFIPSDKIVINYYLNL